MGIDSFNFANALRHTTGWKADYAAETQKLRAQWAQSGMRTLKMDGMEKIMLGLTDLKQVRSVCIK